MNKTVLKARHGAEMRKNWIHHNNDVSLNDLVAKMQRYFDIRDADGIKLKYKDEENDWITLTNDDDLAFALATMEVLFVDVLTNGENGEEADEVQSLSVVQNANAERVADSLTNDGAVEVKAGGGSIGLLTEIPLDEIGTGQKVQPPAAVHSPPQQKSQPPQQQFFSPPLPMSSNSGMSASFAPPPPMGGAVKQPTFAAYGQPVQAQQQQPTFQFGNQNQQPMIPPMSLGQQQQPALAFGMSNSGMPAPPPVSAAPPPASMVPNFAAYGQPQPTQQQHFHGQQQPFVQQPPTSMHFGAPPQAHGGMVPPPPISSTVGSSMSTANPFSRQQR